MIMKNSQGEDMDSINNVEKFMEYESKQEQEGKTLKTGELSASERLEYSDTESLQTHNVRYDALLSVYVKNAEKQLEFKLFAKSMFFLIVVGIMFRFVWIVFDAVSIYGVSEVSENFVHIGGLLTGAIALPTILAKYLFNTEEEKYMCEIIRGIQKHDRFLRKRIDS